MSKQRLSKLIGSFKKRKITVDFCYKRGLTKMQLTDEQINTIAEDLESSMRVYVHIDTKEIKTIIDWEESVTFDEGMWDDVIHEIEKESDKYVEFEKMSSNEFFAVMEEFVDTIGDAKLQKQLELALSVSKPYMNFRNILRSYPDHRKKWHEFKRASYVDWVRTQLEHYNHQKIN